MKVRVKFVLLAVLLGISSLLEAQNLPDFFKGLTPWVNDSIPVYKGYRCVGEWGEELYSYYYDDDYRIERNEKENWVSSYRSYSSFYDTDNDNESDSLVVTEETSTKYFNENQSIDSVIVVTISKDSLGSVVEYRKDREIYNETGELVSRINFLNKNGVITCDTFFIDDTNSLCPEGSVVTESGDTTICSFSSSYADILEKYNKYGDLIYSSYTGTIWGTETIRTYEYDDERNLIRETSASYSELNPTSCDYECYDKKYEYDSKGILIRTVSKNMDGDIVSVTNYEYDSKGQLIRERDEYSYGGGIVNDYVYDHLGNLTLEFSYRVDEYYTYYSGDYTIYEYEGGKKMYAPFDAKKYPTDKYPANSPVAKHGKLQVKGTNIVGVNGEIVQLKGISTHGISWFPECYSEGSISSLVEDWGINVFRIASYVENQVEKKDWEERKVFIDSLVDLCGKYGVYCIIDWHVLYESSRGDSTGDPWFRMKEAKEFFEYMSRKHAGKAHVMYEICNEPSQDPSGNSLLSVSWARVKSYAQEIIDVIVENDPNSIIIVGTPVWSQRVIAAADSPLDYPNAMYALHFYADSHRQKLRDEADIALDKNCPIFVSEFGTCNESGGGNVNVAETINWLEWMNENNISWVNWNFADKKESSSLLNEGSCEAEDWLNITNSGRIIKWALSDAELSRSDSVIVVEKALKDLRLFLNTDERKDYFQNCIHENKENIELMSSEDLRDCVYAKECVAENSDIANDATAINKCVREKRDGIEDVLATLEDVKVYPNSVEDYFTVACFSGDFKVSMIDLDGEMVVTQNCSKGECQLNISYLAPGVYLLVVENNGKCYYEKIIKE
ncbi:MAG: cellulase family glycosylhydrolase [Paludibacteraceae bacterium]|nr:cellulase family glycosylhydrolase [Paludibacteraceae bacterium]